MALTEYKAFAAANVDKVAEAARTILLIKGAGTTDMYVLEADPTTGAIPASATPVAATFQVEGTKLGTAITNVYQAVLTPASNPKILILRSTCNQPIMVSLDAGTTGHFTLNPGDAITLDLSSNLMFMTAAAIHVKFTSVVPTDGSFFVNVVR